MSNSNGVQVLSQQNPRILLLNWRDLNNPLAGGAEVHVWEVFERLVAKGWAIEAICAGFSEAQKSETIEGISVTRVGMSWNYHVALPSAYFKVTKRFQPDIVIDFMNKLPLYTPLFVKEPLCCFVHHLFGTSAIREVGLLAGAVIRAYEFPVPFVYRNTPFFTGSQSSVEELQGMGLKKVAPEALPYGVQTEIFNPSEKSAHPSILYLGRLKEYKGVDHILRVLPRLLKDHPELIVNIAGGGDAEDSLKALANKLGVEDAVHFYGYVTEEEKLRLYQEAWIACLPSFKEGFGLTIPEAALCETPTVGYDVPGLMDAIENEKTGELVPYGDLDKFGDSLIRMLGDEEYRKKLGEQARERYLSFTWDEATARMEEQLLGVMEGARS